jgi:hypothetical protein
VIIVRADRKKERREVIVVEAAKKRGSDLLELPQSQQSVRCGLLGNRLHKELLRNSPRLFE